MTEENTVKNDGKKIYEVGYLLLPNINENNISDEVSKIRDITEKNDGVFLSGGMPEMKALAYSMIKTIGGKKQKFDNAYFGWIKFESDSINEIKEDLDNMKNILRHLIVTTTKENAIASSSNNVKKGKFSFEEEKVEKPGESKKKEEKEVVTLDEKEKIEIKEDAKDKTKSEESNDKEKKESSKKLDETIDDLVIK